jgi:hypothetical protein
MEMEFCRDEITVLLQMEMEFCRDEITTKVNQGGKIHEQKT